MTLKVILPRVCNMNRMKRGGRESDEFCHESIVGRENLIAGMSNQQQSIIFPHICTITALGKWLKAAAMQYH